MRTSGDQVRAATARRVAELAADLGQEPRRPIVVPEPGRHAARRSSAPRVPGTVLGTVLGPAHLAVLVLVVAAGVALTAWWVVRDQSRQVVESPAPAPAAPLVEESPGGDAAVVPSQGATGTATGVATVTVDVSGKV
ncbi:hypothetical protein, partial [Nocardioides stalactiti]|uniref:hypothetical protein n=1 Tax=Nocardioides stalactiti TaxID=2755356 RepID=UPI001C7F3CA6